MLACPQLARCLKERCFFGEPKVVEKSRADEARMPQWHGFERKENENGPTQAEKGRKRQMATTQRASLSFLVPVNSAGVRLVHVMDANAPMPSPSNGAKTICRLYDLLSYITFAKLWLSQENRRARGKETARVLYTL